MERKGIQTTEFWLTLAGTTFFVLVGTGVLGPEEAEEIQGVVNPFISAAVTLVTYIISRTVVKARNGK